MSEPTVPSLFPRPRELRPLGGRVAADRPVRLRADTSLPAQGYELSVGPDEVRLLHADAAGRRYGEQTLEQLRAPDGTLPGVEVRDWPDLEVRGFMLDVSRDRVPTRETLERLVRLLAVARYNHLQLYVEHTFAFVGHEDVWRHASPLTGEDLEWLDQTCAGAGIELAVNQNCFGHFGRWLAHGAYRHRAECPDGLELPGGIRFPPGVLAPTEDNAAFALDLVRQQLAHVQSRRVNIGCDETFELGRGISAGRAAEIGTVGVYLEHLHRLASPLLAEGCRVQLWGDVVGSHPERVSDLPSGDVTALVWSYDAPGAPTPAIPPALAPVLREIGIDLHSPTDFSSRLAPFVQAGVPFWVAPGTSSWSSLVGRWDNARANLLDAARAAVDHGALGCLVTDWGDNGHHQPPSVSDLPLLYGGAVAWCPAANADVDAEAAVDRFAARDETGTVGRVLATIGSAGSRTGVVARNLSPLFHGLFPHLRQLTSGQPDRDALAGVIADLLSARADLAAARPAAPDGPEVREELDVAIGLALHGARRLEIAAGGDDPGPAALRADLAPLVDRYRDAWLARARPGGLADSLRHLERTLSRYDPG